MKKLKLIYWETDIENYGDLLSPYIISKLSGCQIIKKNYFVGNWKSHIFHLYKSILNLDLNLKSQYLLPFERNVLGIGSILSKGNSKSLIWGSGFMSKDEVCSGGVIYAIRGYDSLRLLNHQIGNGAKIKLAKNCTIGDPALLLPLIISPSKHKTHKIGIIPHFSETQFFMDNYGDKFHIINLQSADIDCITSEITSCERILSTSLHGIIVAHSYGIPALWMESTGLEKGTNGFKFYDYFSSVKISPYSPIRNFNEYLENEEDAIRWFELLNLPKLPNVDIPDIQHKLLSSSPFPIRYNNMISSYDKYNYTSI